MRRYREAFVLLGIAVGGGIVGSLLMAGVIALLT